jgi:glyoxylase-like metal-dependent hydrolase (beta-lactamase superfamily II)
VITAPNPSPLTLSGTNTYLIAGGGKVTIIDPGPDDRGHVARLLEETSGRRVTLILLTHGHSDHRGASDHLARATGAPVRGWQASDAPLREDEDLEVPNGRLRAIHTPGHAPDHVAFYWEARGVLFSGDLILGEGTVQVTPPAGSMVDYLRSLDRVARLDLTLIAPGHGPLIRSPRRRIADYLAHRRMREQQVLDALAAGARTAQGVAAVIYPDLDPRLRGAAEGTVSAHLEKLILEGRVRRSGSSYAVMHQEGSDGGSAGDGKDDTRPAGPPDPGRR